MSDVPERTYIHNLTTASVSDRTAPAFAACQEAMIAAARTLQAALAEVYGPDVTVWFDWRWQERPGVSGGAQVGVSGGEQGKAG